MKRTEQNMMKCNVCQYYAHADCSMKNIISNQQNRRDIHRRHICRACHITDNGDRDAFLLSTEFKDIPKDDVAFEMTIENYYLDDEVHNKMPFSSMVEKIKSKNEAGYYCMNSKRNNNLPSNFFKNDILTEEYIRKREKRYIETHMIKWNYPKNEEKEKKKL